jgi:hypothetical protein
VKRVLSIFLCAALAGCATQPVQTADKCKPNAGFASGGTHMVASGNLAAGLIGLAVIGLTAMAHNECVKEHA